MSIVYKRVRPILIGPGYKYRLANRILKYIPPHKTYIEGCAGGINILLAKPPSQREIVYDLDSRIINLYKVIQTEPTELRELILQTTFSLENFMMTQNRDNDSGLFGAYSFLIQNRMSYMGFNKKFDHRIEKVWTKTEARIAPLAARIKDVTFHIGDIKKKLKKAVSTFIYIDPPYMSSTRTIEKLYQHEMNDSDHLALLKAAKMSDAKIILSGYNSVLYNSELKNWEKEFFFKTLLTSPSKYTRFEYIWRNYV